MLSLTDGKIIARAFNPKTEELQFNIYIKDKKGVEPDIDIEQKSKLITKGDKDVIESRYGLDYEDIDEILQYIDSNTLPDNLDRRLRRGYRKVKEMLQEKLKKELDFSDMDNIELFPVYDPYEEKKWLGHIYVAGPTGAGKSYFIKQLCLEDKKKRPIYLLSRVPNDPSYKEIRRLKRFVPYDLRPPSVRKRDNPDLDIICGSEDYPDIPKMEDFKKHSLVIFDDINTISNKKIRDEVFALLQDCLECGRHRKINIITTNHLLTDYSRTKKMLNEAQFFTLYPRSQFNSCSLLLKYRYGIQEAERNKILKDVASESRWLFMSSRFPVYFITKKRVLVI